MLIEERTNRGIETIPMESRLLTQRKIILNGRIDQEMVSDIFEQMAYLLSISKAEPVNVYINSPGGSVDAGLLLLDMFTTCDTPVDMYCLSSAYSMAALLFAAGNHKRYMLPNSKLMIHEPLIGSNSGGSTSDIMSLAEDLEKTRSRLNQILARSCGKTEEEIEKMTDHDNYLTAEDAVEIGFCDEIVSFDKYVEV